MVEFRLAGRVLAAVARSGTRFRRSSHLYDAASTDPEKGRTDGGEICIKGRRACPPVTTCLLGKGASGAKVSTRS